MFNPIIWPSAQLLDLSDQPEPREPGKREVLKKNHTTDITDGPVDSHTGSLTPTAMITTVGGGTTTPTATTQKIHTRTGWLIDGTEVTMSMSIIETNYLCFTLIHYVS